LATTWRTFYSCHRRRRGMLPSYGELSSTNER
jgi:hypothetical protein